MVNRLREFREKLNWTQTKLAEESGVSRVTINQIESGKAQTVKTDTLTKIADAMNEKVTTIFFYDESLTCCTPSVDSSGQFKLRCVKEGGEHSERAY